MSQTIRTHEPLTSSKRPSSPWADVALGLLPLLAVSFATCRMLALPTSRVLLTALSYATLGVLLLAKLPPSHPGPGLGPANRLTLARATLVLPLATLALLPGALTGAGYWWLVGLSAVALVLDGLDGPLARRTGTESAFGARFDMELDAFLLLALSALVWRSGKVGSWVLLVGGMRYLFVLGGVLWPPLRGALPASMRRKVVCVVQGIVLVVCLAPVTQSVPATAFAASALLLLTYSFVVDTWWLVRVSPARFVSFESADVARYYDRNTAGFLAHGQGGAQGIIHRAVWAEGVGSRDVAFHYVHDLLRARIAESGARRVLDLGCGVGASLEYILRGTEVSGYGVTNSAVHADLAQERLSGRAEISELDFCSDPLPAPVDLAFGIESFVQAPDAEAFIANVARVVAPDGYLVLCDDFLAGSDEDESRWVGEFRRGWRASSLLSTGALDSLAAAHGFELLEDRDLTPFLELDRPRDRALGQLIALMRPFAAMNARLESHVGGNALRQCLKRGLVEYRYRVFRAGGSDSS